MPVFFNEQTLSNIEFTHYQHCVNEYHRIQFINAENEKNQLRISGKLTSNMALEIDNKAKYHKPSNKSALFWRLLQGKKALPTAPPTSFSYPWYQLYEEEGPFSVHVSWDRFEDHLFNLSFLPKKKDKILINHAVWTIHSLNDAASLLLNLKSSNSQKEIQHVFSLTPEMIVSFDNHDKYRLFLGRKIIYGRRITVLNKPVCLETGGSNPIILEVINKGEDLISQQIQKIDLPNSSLEGYDNMLESKYMQSLLKGQATDEFDWLKIEIDAWILEAIPH